MTEPVMPDGPHVPPEGAHVEVYVVGRPNSVTVGGKRMDYPPYRFRWDGEIAERARDGMTPMQAAEAFVAKHHERVAAGYAGWLEGPRIVTRTATYGPWTEHP